MSEGATRREFLRTLARVLLLLGIGALGAKLLGRGARTAGGPQAGNLPGQTCLSRGICRGCSAFSGCGLPQALSARSRASRARPDGGRP